MWLVYYYSVYSMDRVFICVFKIFSFGLTELPILSRGPTHFMNVYPELVIQHDVNTQADMFLACFSPKEPGTPVVDDDATGIFTEDTYVNII